MISGIGLQPIHLQGVSANHCRAPRFQGAPAEVPTAPKASLWKQFQSWHRQRNHDARLFIYMKGFFRDWQWAREANQAIQDTVPKLDSFKNLREVFDHLATQYRQSIENQNDRYMNDWGHLCKKMLHDIVRLDHKAFFETGFLRLPKNVGWWRGEGGSPFWAAIKIKGLYKPYEKRALQHLNQTFQADLGELGRVDLVTTKYGADYSKFFGGEVLRWELPDSRLCYSNSPSPVFEKTWQHLEMLYQQTRQLAGQIKSGVVSKNIESLGVYTQGVAKMQWFLSQLMPFHRGSAGVTDMLAKTLFDDVGIAVGCFKRGLAPDLEAFVRPLEDYVKAYSGFFRRPLRFEESASTK